MTHTAKKLTPEYLLETFGLSVTAVFVPYSKSRNYKEGAKIGDKSLNWRVTLRKSSDLREPIGSAREVITCDYSAGIGHCPGYKQNSRVTLEYAALIDYEVEHGYPGRSVYLFPNIPRAKSNVPILPDPVDVIYSLVGDASAIDHPTYESWAAEYGYDEDSRKGEATYRACLEIGIKLRAAVGDGQIEKLREAFCDY